MSKEELDCLQMQLKVLKSVETEYGNRSIGNVIKKTKSSRIMEFKVGDKIKIVKPFLRMGRNHVGEIGTITELRCYCSRIFGKAPTHYVVKFNCFKIPHVYMQSEIEDSCDLIK